MESLKEESLKRSPASSGGTWSVGGAGGESSFLAHRKSLRPREDGARARARDTSSDSLAAISCLASARLMIKKVGSPSFLGIFSVVVRGGDSTVNCVLRLRHTPKRPSFECYEMRKKSFN